MAITEEPLTSSQLNDHDVHVRITDIGIIGFSIDLLKSKCFLTITAQDYTITTRTLPASNPTWPEILNFTASAATLVELRLMRKKLLKSPSFLAGVSISVAEIIALDVHDGAIKPIPLKPNPQLAGAPKLSISFKLSFEEKKEPNKTERERLLDQMHNSVARIQPSPSPDMAELEGTIDQIHHDISRAQTLASGLPTLNSVGLNTEEQTLVHDDVAKALLKASGALSRFMTFAQAISDLHPYAKIAVGVLSSAYTAWKAQTERDEKVAALASTVADLWEFMTQDPSLEKIKQVQKTIAAMMDQTAECAEFIRDFTTESNKVARLANNVFSDTDQIEAAFMQSFQKLKEDFLAGLNVSVMLTVMETQQSIVETRKTLERLELHLTQVQHTDAVPVPLPLQPIVARFPSQPLHGREDYVSRMAATILSSSEGSHIPILGPGGMGKTSIALAVVNHPDIVKHFGKRRHFIPCDEVSKPVLLIALIANHLGISASSTNPLGDVITSLGTSSTAAAVVLDNFETPWDPYETKQEVELIIGQLSCVPKLSLLITMRGTVAPSEVQWTYTPSEVGRLSLEAARSTFLDKCHYTDSSLDALLSALDFVPLAITLMAAVGQADELPPSELIKLWENEQTSVLNLAPNNRLKSVDQSIRLSLQSAPMTANPDALRLLSVIALLPGGVQLKNLSELTKGIGNIIAARRTLIRASLLYKDNNSILRLLSPVRSYVQQHHPLSTELRTNFRLFYYKLAERCHVAPGDPEFLVIRDEMALENSNMDTVVAYTLSTYGDEDAVRAAINYSYYLRFTHPREDIITAAVAKARAGGFAVLLGSGLHQLGAILMMQARYDEARGALQDARQHYLEVGNQQGASQCLQSLGIILSMRIQYDEAKVALDEARQEFLKAGNTRGAAQCHQRLGDILRVQERYDEAQPILLETRKIFQEISDRLGASQCLQSLADILRMQNHYEEARLVLEDARAEFLAIGDQRGATQCLQPLADILRMQANYTEAEATLREARQTFLAIGNHLGASQCQQTLADILRMQDRFDEPLAALQGARKEFIRIGDRRGATQCLQSQGDMFRMQDRHADAKNTLQQAINEFSSIGDIRGIGQCRLRIGDSLRMEVRYDEAWTWIEDAKSIFLEIEDIRGVAHCLTSMSDILRMRNSYEEAIVMLKDARKQLLEIRDGQGAAQCLLRLGDVFRMQDRYDEARTAIEEATDAFAEVRNRRSLAQCQRIVGNMLQIQRQYDEAEVKLRDARGEFLAIGARRCAYQCFQSLGDMRRMQDQYEEAQAILEKARSKFQKTDDKQGAAQCLRSLADISLMQGRYDDAQTSFQEARKEYEGIDDRRGAAQCLQRMGDILWMTDHIDDAQKALHEARETFIAIHDRRGASQCLQSLGDILRIQSSDNESRAALEEARQTFAAIGDSMGVAQCEASLRELGVSDDQKEIVALSARRVDLKREVAESMDLLTNIDKHSRAEQP